MNQMKEKNKITIDIGSLHVIAKGTAINQVKNHLKGRINTY